MVGGLGSDAGAGAWSEGGRSAEMRLAAMSDGVLSAEIREVHESEHEGSYTAGREHTGRESDSEQLNATHKHSLPDAIAIQESDNLVLNYRLSLMFFAVIAASLAFAFNLHQVLSEGSILAVVDNLDAAFIFFWSVGMFFGAWHLHRWWIPVSIPLLVLLMLDLLYLLLLSYDPVFLTLLLLVQRMVQILLSYWAALSSLLPRRRRQLLNRRTLSGRKMQLICW
mmetsp:Transcript_8391/g.18325  ORF Transcript_8391/g.18325 Transcript_8391/m.18325 type:complete len:224 (-) Transcript_8391:131-802(-)